MTFEEMVVDMVGKTALDKGYDGGKGQLFELTNNLQHPLGEIIYKVIRYNQKRDVTDLIKIAAWAKLVYERDTRTAQMNLPTAADLDAHVEQMGLAVLRCHVVDCIFEEGHEGSHHKGRA